MVWLQQVNGNRIANTDDSNSNSNKRNTDYRKCSTVDADVLHTYKLRKQQATKQREKTLETMPKLRYQQLCTIRNHSITQEFFNRAI